MFRLTMVSSETRGGRNLTRRRFLILAALAIAVIAPATPQASASSSASDVAVLEDCRERAVIVPGVEKLVRRRVPAQFELVRDPLGRPLLAVTGGRCERYSLGSPPRPTNFTFFVAVIESPDGSGCLSRWPVLGAVKPDLLPLCNYYVFVSAYDNPAVVDAQRAAVPDFPAYYVPDLAFETGRFDPTRLGTPFRFRAGAPTPSPFELNASVREGSLAGPNTFTFWFRGASGTFGGRLEVDDFEPGQMDATLRAAPGSEMATLLGTETPTPLLGLPFHYDHAEGRLLSPGGAKPTTFACNDRRATIAGSGRIDGTAGDDVIVGAARRDLIDGQGGNDRICAGRGRDRLRGGRGRDRLFGQQGRDRLSGGGGRDRLFGGPGSDRLHGGTGRDRLSGGPGNDRIATAGGGRDVVNCGSGADRVWADHRDRLRRCERVRRPR